MNADELRALQAPLKAKYREDPGSARVTLVARGKLTAGSLNCKIETGKSQVEAGLHPAAGGDGTAACSGEMLLEALASCAGVTLRVVASALNIPIRGGTVIAEGDMDFCGTLGLSKEVPAGVTEVRLRFDLDTDATPEQMQTLIRLTERYCVVFQTLQKPPKVDVSISSKSSL